MEAVKLGSATVGLKSRDYAVLVALKRASSELASYQKKIIPIDDHLGISIAGITADARVLSKLMRQECLNYKFSFDSTYPVSRLISKLGNRMQLCTQRYDRRPYGVGLLVAGYDDQGPQIFEVVPSANFFSCKAMSIGSRSQSARTYLEKHLNSFVDSTKDELIKHGLEALKGTLPNEDLLTNLVRPTLVPFPICMRILSGFQHENGSALTSLMSFNTFILAVLQNISIAIVGKDEKFRILNDEEIKVYVAAVEKRGGPGGSGGSGDASAAPAPPADDPRDERPGDADAQVAMEA